MEDTDVDGELAKVLSFAISGNFGIAQRRQCNVDKEEKANTLERLVRLFCQSQAMNAATSHKTELAPLLNRQIAEGLKKGSQSSGQLVQTPKQPVGRAWNTSIFSFRLLLATAFAIALSLVTLGWSSESRSLAELHPFDYAARTQRLLSRYGVFDGHNDLVCTLRTTMSGDPIGNETKTDLIRVELKNKIHDTAKFTLGEGLLSHTYVHSG